MKIQKYGKANMLTRFLRSFRKKTYWGTCGIMSNPLWDTSEEEG